MSATLRSRAAHVLIWIAALFPPIGVLGYVLYQDLLTQAGTRQLDAPYDGFYFDAAQFQIAYAQLENQVLMYKAGVDGDYANVTLRYAIVQSKLRVLSGTMTRLDARPAVERRQRFELGALARTIDALGPDVDALHGDRARADGIVLALRRHWDEVNDLAQRRRLVDVADHDAIESDFHAKRRLLLAFGGLLLLSSVAAATLLVFNNVRRTRLIAQQRAALVAEQEAARAASEASLAKDTFLGMVSHELRTPLHAIVTSVELLGLEPQPEAEAARKVMRRLETAARHLEAQMRDLTDYARLGAGKLALRHERFDPRALVEAAVDEHAALASAKRLVLTSTMQGLAGLVESDPHRIGQIVRNLVSNAIKYTETGAIRVALDAQADALRISVTDTGPGVPEATIPLLFKEFTQFGMLRERRLGGAGMGLAIVRGLVDLLGGEVDVASRVGEGTTFAVTIPVKRAELPQGQSS